MQTLHRVWQRLVGARRTLLNQLKTVLFERRHVIAQGRCKLELAVDELLAVASGLGDRMHDLVAEMRAEWCELDHRIDALNAEFTARARMDVAARRLATTPGIGVLNATALVAAVGDGGAFRLGRDLAP
jgi:transposase